MTVREELDLFVERVDDLIGAKYILADVKIVNVLKSIASSSTLLALFKNCLTDFDYELANKKYLVKNRFLGGDKGEFIIPPNTRELLAFVFRILMDIDSKDIDFCAFIDKYFYVDGSFSAGYDAFINGMIKPFRNSVKVLMENVLAGSLQDPVSALEEENIKREKQKEKEEIDAKKQEELLKKSYGQSVNVIRDILIEQKKKANEKSTDEVRNQEIALIIDTLYDVLDSQDKQAITYAYTSYKYLAKCYKFTFYFGFKKIESLIKDVLNEI